MSQTLDLLHENIFNCTKCHLAENRCFVTVKRGNNDSPILIVGEAPGEQEDTSGIPFIGDSGAILERILLSVGIDSKDVYVTNLVKCRPPDNRKPTSAEINACKHWLVGQILTIKPKILVLLGASAYQGLLGNKWYFDEIEKAVSFGITKHRGIWFESRYCKNTICSFHPAYLLYNYKLDEGSPKYLAWKDWISIKEKLDTMVK